jgi:hypothetical protein
MHTLCFNKISERIFLKENALVCVGGDGVLLRNGLRRSQGQTWDDDWEV